MSVQAIPEGYRTITPYLRVSDAQGLISFIEQAFGGRAKERSVGPDGKVSHAAMWIGDSILMLGQASPAAPPIPSMLYLYVPDVDSVFGAAQAAGARVVRELATQAYGDRNGGLEDPFGNQWWVATHVEDVSEDEIARRYQQAAGSN